MEWLPRDLFGYEVVERLSPSSAPAPSQPEAEPANHYVTVVADIAEVRDNPFGKGELILIVKKGDRLQWTGRSVRDVATGKYSYLVMLEGGETGYMIQEDIEETQ
ncbi:hypothetical protein [Cohnella hongkongensis]|uniref:Uncharacterized protein n=1 Tax=Cohnella hongkongensis TaxID=178337 RepID=A0ABV9FMF3_9BACL